MSVTQSSSKITETWKQRSVDGKHVIQPELDTASIDIF